MCHGRWSCHSDGSASRPISVNLTLRFCVIAREAPPTAAIHLKLQLDGRVATLQEQALGALTNHAKIQTAPPQRLLDDLASFQRELFTNRRVRALADAVQAGTTPLPDPDR